MEYTYSSKTCIREVFAKAKQIRRFNGLKLLGQPCELGLKRPIQTTLWSTGHRPHPSHGSHTPAMALVVRLGWAQEFVALPCSLSPSLIPLSPRLTLAAVLVRAIVEPPRTFTVLTRPRHRAIATSSKPSAPPHSALHPQPARRVVRTQVRAHSELTAVANLVGVPPSVRSPWPYLSGASCLLFSW